MDFGVIPTGGKNKLTIISGVFYEIPNGATHVYLRNGQISFGLSLSPKKEEKSTKGRFVKIPEGAQTVAFPEYIFKASGHFYGRPAWL